MRTFARNLWYVYVYVSVYGLIYRCRAVQSLQGLRDFTGFVGHLNLCLSFFSVVIIEKLVYLTY